VQKSCEIASMGGALVWFEPVSTVKAERAAGLLHQITFTSPNAAELIAMADAGSKPNISSQAVPTLGRHTVA
jgi:hypothetical protein